MSSTRSLFVAGSNGATGKVLVPMAESLGLKVVPHLRPKTAASLGSAVPQNAAVLELNDHAALVKAMRGCTTVIQLIGTMRKRFSKGDTYESSDIGTTVQLVNAAREAGVDHMVLLSSYGAGRPMGAYLQAKAKAEDVVKESGLGWTVFRPSALVGGERKKVPLLGTLTKLLGMKGAQPIALEDLSRAMLWCAKGRAPLSTAVEGASLWALVDASRV